MEYRRLRQTYHLQYMTPIYSFFLQNNFQDYGCSRAKFLMWNIYYILWIYICIDGSQNLRNRQKIHFLDTLHIRWKTDPYPLRSTLKGDEKNKHILDKSYWAGNALRFRKIQEISLLHGKSPSYPGLMNNWNVTCVTKQGNIHNRTINTSVLALKDSLTFYSVPIIATPRILFSTFRWYMTALCRHWAASFAKQISAKVHQKA